METHDRASLRRPPLFWFIILLVLDKKGAFLSSMQVLLDFYDGQFTYFFKIYSSISPLNCSLFSLAYCTLRPVMEFSEA